MVKLDCLGDFLETYSGRDKILRTMFYAAQIVAGSSNNDKLQKKMNVLSEQIDSCRIVLRLLDDLPMLCFTRSYGLGKQEPDKVLQSFGVAANVIDQLYYPLEHIAWAADHKLIEVDSEPWWMASNVCWALSSYLTTLKSFRYYFLLKHSRRFAGESQIELKLTRALERFELNELLTAARCLLDFIHAIHWMPSGVLWSGKLKQWHIGTLGLISSLISLYQSNIDLSVVKVF